ncbi:MAG: carbohydrate kinase [Clostridia bacterium]|nr:carbohydrate kinase [Clostridia bacterium]
MILSIGEILVDLFRNGETSDMFAGGAPFNAVSNAKLCGAVSGFVGKVGNDSEGEFLKAFASKLNFDMLCIATDEIRPTTKAIVTIDENGERSFVFSRENTADYHLKLSEVPLDELDEDDIVHIGSLMLSTKEGQEFSKKLIYEIKLRNLVLSFDVNFREDLFETQEKAINAYNEVFKNADILKFSQEEILYFAKTDSLAVAISMFMKKDRLLVVTLGSKGSLFVKDGKSVIAPAAKIEKVVDTTGAGDAFMGGLLYKLDGRNWRGEGEKFFADALHFANALGAFCVTKKGAINKF